MTKYLAYALMAIAWGCTDPQSGSNPKGPNPNLEHPSLPFAKTLQTAESVELFSLWADSNESTPLPWSKEKPKERAVREEMHGWPILGKTILSKSESGGKAVAAFLQAVRPVKASDALPRCFQPRHAIRATHQNKMLDLVICFECSKVQVYEDGQSKPVLFVIDGSRERLFDDLLRGAKIALSREHVEK